MSQPFDHDETPAIGILVANLGTPDAPTTKAVRRYLREFLSDPRVIDLPKWKWQIILNLFVLTTRPQKSAAAYREVWTKEGSPLLATSRKQAAGIEAGLRKDTPGQVHVALGMRYGKPSIDSALKELEENHCRRVLLFPLYPQWSATTTASTFDALAEAFKTRGWMPHLRMVRDYYDDEGYIGALANSVREVWDKDGEPERLLISFHGIPKRYFTEGGDPYFCFCSKTARMLREALGRTEENAVLSFQSRFGKEEWLQPYTDATLKAWAKAGVESVDVICPGFSADCLETIEEIDQENRGYFLEAGGKQFRYIPALNDRADHIATLVRIAERHLQGWL
ncbi:MAG: ferrochelatase [Planctomycetota bacterium]|jgi:ferrochelatase